MKTIIENSLYCPHLWEMYVNSIVNICITSENECELRRQIRIVDHWQYEDAMARNFDLKWGFGHNHFWLSEGKRRILFVDFTDQK